MTGFDLSDLDTDPRAGEKPRNTGGLLDRVAIVNGGNAVVETFACPKCGGSGRLRYGYINIQYFPCRMCKETGKVTSQRVARVESAKRARVTAERNLNDKIATFTEENGDIVRFVRENAHWSDFYRSMCDAIDTYGRLTDGQIGAVRRGIEKAAQKAAERTEKRQTNGGQVDVSAIEALFDGAKQSGLKRLKFRTERIDISVAPETGRNAGSLYVFDNGEYTGKITSGRFIATNATQPDVLGLIQQITVDPAGVARLYGQQTGNCSLCGKELTDPNSIAEGIGPICAGKWRL